MSTDRIAGASLLAYVTLTVIALLASGTPGGDYDVDALTAYVGGGFAVSIVACGAGAAGALALIPFARGVAARSDGLASVPALGTAAAAVGVAGWFIAAAMPIVFVEAGPSVREALPLAVVQTLGETGVLVSLCAPAFVMGAVALVLVVGGGWPMWLRVLSVAGGVSGLTAPAFVTFFVYLLWCAVAAVALLMRVRVRARGTGAPVPA